MSTDIVWLLVAYRNMEAVDQYIDQLDRLRSPSTSYVFGICDNSPEPASSRHARRSDVYTVERPDNPGYLDGARAALDSMPSALRDRATWVALSNTDLSFVSSDPVEILKALGADRPLLVAPRISEDDGAIEKNPHVVIPRSPARHRLNHLMTYTPSMAIGYLLLSRGRHLLQLRRPTDSRPPADPGQIMYSPYGALIFFSRAFMDAPGLPAGVPLLAEEFAIAEAARRAQAPVVYEPRIHVDHVAHSTTGPKVSRPRAAMLSRAFAYVAQNSKDPG